MKDKDFYNQLLEEAKRKYPPGTKFLSAYNVYHGIIGEDSITVAGTKICFYLEGSNAYGEAICEEYSEGLLYYKGTWATIDLDKELEEVRKVIYD